MWLAAGSIYPLRLTDAIHEEWTRNVLRDYPNLTPVQFDRTRALMNKIAPETLVKGYEAISETVTLPDPNDRHVLAAAIHAKAGVIVTFNLKDFPASALAPHGITAESPDTFVSGLMQNEGRRQEIVALVRRARANLKKPPKTVDEYLDGLRRNHLTQTVDLLAQHAREL